MRLSELARLGDPARLMTTGALTLAAISAGAVFMGANSYIGNAPNFMVYAIAREAGVKMPSFFGYVGWSLVLLIPCFLIVTFVLPTGTGFLPIRLMFLSFVLGPLLLNSSARSTERRTKYKVQSTKHQPINAEYTREAA